MNYDMVFENSLNALRYNGLYQQFGLSDHVIFETTIISDDWDQPLLAKLHGSVDKQHIVPPTWAKGQHPEVIPAWQFAYATLRSSNQIRFIGYSLPITDSYLRYLLRTAVLDTQHLKKIDVITLDSDGTTKQRYDEFITFPYYTFCNADVEGYLRCIVRAGASLPTTKPNEYSVLLEGLEAAHKRFVGA